MGVTGGIMDAPTCIRCLRFLREDARFCHVCGHRAPAPPIIAPPIITARPIVRRHSGEPSGGIILIVLLALLISLVPLFVGIAHFCRANCGTMNSRQRRDVIRRPRPKPSPTCVVSNRAVGRWLTAACAFGSDPSF